MSQNLPYFWNGIREGKSSLSQGIFRMSTHCSFFLFSQTFSPALFQPSQISQLIIFQTYLWMTHHISFEKISFSLFSLSSSIFSPQKKNLLEMSQLLLFNDIKILRTCTFVRVYSQTRISSLTIHALNMIQEQEVAITNKKSWKQSMEDNIWKYPQMGLHFMGHQWAI